jgi:YgiT-type zinc finger domain-containing protein
VLCYAKEDSQMNITEIAGKPCDQCGQGIYIIKEVQEPVTANGKTILVTVMVAECSHCSERVYDDTAVHAIQAVHEQLAASA